MHFRHEIKHVISQSDFYAVKQSMSGIALTDPHAGLDGTYLIRSLYFDNVYNTALNEKRDGIAQRDKFRIRYYNGDLGFIVLEKKSKTDAFTSKLSEPITLSEVERLLNGDYEWLNKSEKPLFKELYGQMTLKLLRPRCIVEYTRIPFIYAPGNVRVTLDYDIRTGLSSLDFLNPASVTVPAGNGEIILEVKWDEYLPDIIRHAVQLKDTRAGSFSKYENARFFI